MISDKPSQWSRWLPLTEWWYNTAFHTSLQLTPFEALYSYLPPLSSIPQNDITSVRDVQEFLQERKVTFQAIKARLQEAQQRMKYFADQHRTECSFAVGVWVFLRLQPYI